MTAQTIAGLHSHRADLRRGACPTLSRPMRTGDGLLARLRPEDCVLTLAQLRTVARAAEAFGNGIIEVTARGSLQVRGLRPETVAPLEQAVLDAEITLAAGLMVEVPPLAGVDPGELIDPRPLAKAIRHLAASHWPVLVLAPKLAVVVDGGGRFHLGAVTADIRLTAIDDRRLLLTVGGTDLSARKVAVVSVEQAASAVLQVLEAIATIGPTVRGRDVNLTALGEIYEPAASANIVRSKAISFLGIQGPSAELHTLGLALPYRQAQAGDLIAFLDEVEVLGFSEIRLSPGHGLILAGSHHAEVLAAEAAARRHGFWTSPREPRANIALCAGTSGCASAIFDTKAAAEEIARRAAGLLDGSVVFHLSGCLKGCAHPAPAEITITGAPSGYGLVVNGAASHAPALYIGAKELGIALERLASHVAGAKETGETARDCLVRLGPAAIVAALTLA